MRSSKGLELSRDYFEQIGLPAVRERFPVLSGRLAAGLVGEGSDCFGYDDEISRDHSWGPGFCIWLEAEDYGKYGAAVQQLYDSLSDEFGGFKKKTQSPFEAKRIGAFETGAFYKGLIGLPYAPKQIEHWMAIPEGAFASAVNGEVFIDESGEFSSIRNDLLAYFPEDIRLKKLAGRCANAAQSGQYNLPRCLKRGERVAAEYARAQFCESATAIVFLINRTYMPFYKWSHRMLSSLPVLGQSVASGLTQLCDTPMFAERSVVDKAEEISQTLISELKKQSLTDSSSDFLLDHSAGIQARIENEKIRRMPATAY